MNYNYEHVLRQIAESVRYQYGLDVETEIVRGCEFFPENYTVATEGGTTGFIRFNPKVKTILTLYNRALERGEDIGETVTHYALFHAFLELDDYDNARRHLEAFRNEIHRLKLSRRSEEERQDEENRILLQVYFTLFHESCHLIFCHLPELKNSAMETTRELLHDMKMELEHQLSTVATEELLSHPKTLEQIHSLVPQGLSPDVREEIKKMILEEMSHHPYSTDYFDELLGGSDEPLLEELACDRLAWLNFSLMAKEDGYTSEDLLQFHLWFYVVFCAVDFNRNILSQYRPAVRAGHTYDGRRIVLRHGAFKTLLRQYQPEIYRLIDSQYLDRHKGLSSIFRTAILDRFKYEPDFLRLHELYLSNSNIPDFQVIKQLSNEMDKTTFEL